MDNVTRPIPRLSDLALSGEVLHRLWQESLSTLQSLQTSLGVTASGPDDQFHAIFGRDSLWTVLLALEAGRLLQAPTQKQEIVQFSAYANWLHDLSASVLRGLAHLQGRAINDVNEEQPGRIVHEYWNPIPERMLAAHWPVLEGRYYGAFDATFLYMITLARVDAFFDDKALLDELWPNAEAVLQWMLEWSDLDHDGLVEYARRNPQGIGLTNQVWKDSGEAIQSLDHHPIVHPVAWVEVQGYAWAAYAAYLKLAQKRQCLHPAVQQEIQQRMHALQEGLQRFWLSSEQYPAMALDGAKKPFQIVSSNPGHLLWSKCLNSMQAEQISKRLMQPDILTAWGLRTLSTSAHYYNPLMYHCGAIWPFDNAVNAIGMENYGFTGEARQLAECVIQAIAAFNNPVELYTVQPSRWIRSHRLQEEWFLADYFYACSVQTWTVAALLYFIAMLMGN
ncbi:MAG: amylo-alpha-1,6-glucosidase [Ktedonobacteraceae bacterium]